MGGDKIMLLYFYSEKQNQEQLANGRQCTTYAVMHKQKIEFTEYLPHKAIKPYLRKYPDAICVIKTVKKISNVMYKSEN